MPLPPALDPAFEEALRHVLDHPGNLVRPWLVVEIGAAYGLERERTLKLAIALEYFHTASLIFDDLPSMDNARERRGVPCVHRVCGEAGAILTALALINRAYAMIWQAAAGAPAARQAEALCLVEESLGICGALNGQSLDLRYARLPHTPKTNERIAMEKTVALIRLTLELPAILGGASRRELHLLDRIAVFWGLAYQIVDDLKDMHLPASESGKTTARDALLDHPNLAAVLGAEGASARLKRLIGLGERSLDGLRMRRRTLGPLDRLRGQLEAEAARVFAWRELASPGGTE